MKDTPQNDRSEYTDTGFRDGDRREGFGDDGGTRVGRPDGAGSNASSRDPSHGGAHPAPYDAQGGRQTPGRPGTNTTPVPDGIEGAGASDDAQGQQQSRVQASAEGLTPGPAAGDDRTTYDL